MSAPSATTTDATTPQLINCQSRDAVPLAWLRRVARCAVQRLGMHTAGLMTIAFIDQRTMRRLNRRFTGHDRLTDVLSFRYTDESMPSVADAVAGEILIAPAAARGYARRHDIPYRQELARYLIHGLLHWIGYDDRTPRQQRQIRLMEDRLLTQCRSRGRGER